MLFVGADRTRLVGELLARFDRAVAEEGLSVVTLEAPLGWGKTQIVSELYSQLSMLQPRPPYWPAKLDTRDRKTLAPPTVQPEEGASPPWFWWSWQGVRIEGVPAFATAAADAQIQAHITGLYKAVSEANELWRRRLAWTAVSAGKIASWFPALGELARIADAISKGQDAREILSQARHVWSSPERILRDALARSGGRTIEVMGSENSARSQAERAADALTAVSRLLPLILVIEDAHDLDPISIELLNMLRERSVIGLILATARTDGVDGPIVAGSFTHWVETQAAGRIERIRLDRIDDASMLRLGTEWAPKGFDPESLSAVVSYAQGNPLALREMLSLPALSRAVQDGVDVEAVVPEVRLGELDELRYQALRGLPINSQQVLAVASICGSPVPEDWLTHLLTKCMPDLRPPDEIQACIAQGWLRRTAARMVGFDEASQLALVRRSRAEVLAPFQIAACETELVRLLSEIHETEKWHDLPWTVQETALTALVSPPMFDQLDDDLRLRSLIELSELRRRSGRLQELENLAHQLLEFKQTGQLHGATAVSSAELLFDLNQRSAALEILDAEVHRLRTSNRAGDDLAALVALHNLAVFHRSGGSQDDLDVAIDTLAQVIIERDTKLGRTHAHSRAARRDLMHTLAERVRYATAIEVGEELFDDNAAELGATHRETLVDAVALFELLLEDGQPAAAVAELEVVLPDIERVFGRSDVTTLSVRNLLAGAELQAGRVSEAVARFAQNLADRELLLGPDHAHTLFSHAGLGNAYSSAGRLDDALKQHELALAGVERVFGNDHRNTVISRGNLACAYEQLGRSEEALLLCERALADAERLFGPDDLLTLTSLGNLAEVYQSMGRVLDALPLLTRTLEGRERRLGPDHLDTLGSRTNLACALLSAGRLTDALPLLEQCHTDSVHLLGADHPHTLTGLSDLGLAYRHSGRLDEARRAFEQCLDGCERVLGVDHPDTLTVRGYVASAWVDAGWLIEALPLYESCVADSERVLGTDHPSTLTARNNLEIAYSRLGRDEDAVSACEETVARMERTRGESHPETLRSRSNLAVMYKNFGRLNEAISLQEQSVTDHERVHGFDHPDTLTTRMNLAAMYVDAGDIAKAVPACERVLAEQQRLLGPDHPETITGRSNLGGAYLRAGRFDDALEMSRRTLDGCEIVYGADHPKTLWTRINLATVYESAARLDEARVELERVIVDAERVLGANHPTLPRTLYRLAQIELKLNEADSARRHLARGTELLNAADDAVDIFMVHQLEALAEAQGRCDRPAEARASLQRAITIAIEIDGPDSQRVAELRLNLAAIPPNE